MKKLLITLLVLVVLAFGVYIVIGEFSAKPPAPTITVGDNKVTAAQGSYCWDGFFNSICADTSSPPEMIKNQKLKPVIVSPGSELKIEFKSEPKENTMEVNIWLSNEEIENVPLSENVILLPKENGVYIYDVSAKWEKGSSSYAFVIEVQ